MGNALFQMCSQSSLDHFGQDKTIQNQTNQFIFHVPGKKSENTKKSPYGGRPISLLSPIDPLLAPLWAPFVLPGSHSVTRKQLGADIVGAKLLPGYGMGTRQH